MSIQTMIYLLRIGEVKDATSGIRTKAIQSKRKLLAEVTNVGTQTQVLASSVGVTYSYQVELRESMYHNEKYIAFKKKGELGIYEVLNTVKGRSPEFRKLNLIKTKETISGVIVDAS